MAEWSRLARAKIEWAKIARRVRVPLGFLLAVLYFWLARPTWRFIALGAVLIAQHAAGGLALLWS
jgi:hypothetical protein